MQSTNEAIMQKLISNIDPFQVQQALVALELGPTDDVVLNYLDFFTSSVPIRTIDFLHVLPSFDVLNAAIQRSAEGLISNVELNREVIERMDTQIKERIDERCDAIVNFDVREGNPLGELLKDAKDNDAGLVVIGQKSGTTRHGILAKNLARKVDCNALIIPDLSQPKIKKILVPIDFSGNSARALRTAVSLNHQLEKRAQVIALNVYEMPNFSVYRIQKTRQQLKKMIEADRQEAFKHFIHSFVSGYEEEIQTELIEREAPGIAHYLMDFAQDNQVDFMVMGAKGHSPVELLLLGSVTEKMLNDNESIPTLVVK